MKKDIPGEGHKLSQTSQLSSQILHYCTSCYTCSQATFAGVQLMLTTVADHLHCDMVTKEQKYESKEHNREYRPIKCQHIVKIHCKNPSISFMGKLIWRTGLKHYSSWKLAKTNHNRQKYWRFNTSNTVIRQSIHGDLLLDLQWHGHGSFTVLQNTWSKTST